MQALRGGPPSLFASLSQVLAAVTQSAPQDCPGVLASMLHTLELEACGAGGSSLGDLNPQHSLAICLLCTWGWLCVSRRWGNVWGGFELPLRNAPGLR